MSRTQGPDQEFKSREAEQRYQRLEEYDIPDAAIQRYIKTIDKNINGLEDEVKRTVAHELTTPEVEHLILNHQYAGQQSVNYFLITGVERKTFDSIASEVKSAVATEREEVELREPYLAHSDIFDGNLYLAFGFLEPTGDTDPATGIRTNKLVRGRCIAVFRSDTDLVAIRCSNEKIAKKTATQISSALKIERDSASYRPTFGNDFEKKFREELVEKYHNLKIRINMSEDRTVETVRYNASTDEEGVKKDARDDREVKRQLEEQGGDIRMGYVELKNGSKFYLNRDKSKISFLKFEREGRINEITEVIDNVLGETGEYPQEKLEGLGNVPQ